MRRRKFLGLFGATAATPFLPAPAMAAAAKAPYGPAAVHAAIYHAKTRAVFSVWGLAKAANLPLESAEALMGDLARRGVLGPMQGTTFGGRWAASRPTSRNTRERWRRPGPGTDQHDNEKERRLEGGTHGPARHEERSPVVVADVEARHHEPGRFLVVDVDSDLGAVGRIPVDGGDHHQWHE